MRQKRILQKLTANYQAEIHQSHINFLSAAVDALGHGAYLTCTSLGRHLPGNTSVKHAIKRVDYMLRSRCLYQERPYYYQAMANLLISPDSRPLILIDWSSTTPCLAFHILPASIVVGNYGRGLTLYEENHPQKQLTARTVHARFIAKLSEILPANCSPIIITDAGFKVSWFQLITEQGWDYIGRVRGLVHYRMSAGEEDWRHCKNLYKHAFQQGRYLGEIELSKANRWQCHAYTLLKKLKGRKKKTLMGKDSACSASRKNARRAREPWLLVTSLSGGDAISQNVFKCYSKRMQIEEGFRDTKSIQYGMGLKFSKTKSSARFDILLLIATLTHFIMFIIGCIAEKKDMVYQLQANTIKHRRVLSHVFVGFSLWKRGYIPKILTEVPAVLKQLRMEACYAHSKL